MGLATDETSQDPSCPIVKETWSERRRRHAAARNAVNVMMVSAFEEYEPPTTQLTEQQLPPTTSSEGITRTMALDMSTSTPSNTSADVAAQSALGLERSASAPTHRTEHAYNAYTTGGISTIAEEELLRKIQDMQAIIDRMAAENHKLRLRLPDRGQVAPPAQMESTPPTSTAVPIVPVPQYSSADLVVAAPPAFQVITPQSKPAQLDRPAKDRPSELMWPKRLCKIIAESVTAEQTIEKAVSR